MGLVDEVDSRQRDQPADDLKWLWHFSEQGDGKNCRDDGLSDQRGGDDGGGQVSQRVGNGHVADDLRNQRGDEENEPGLKRVTRQRESHHETNDQQAK